MNGNPRTASGYGCNVSAMRGVVLFREGGEDREIVKFGDKTWWR